MIRPPLNAISANATSGAGAQGQRAAGRNDVAHLSKEEFLSHLLRLSKTRGGAFQKPGGAFETGIQALTLTIPCLKVLNVQLTLVEQHVRRAVQAHGELQLDDALIDLDHFISRVAWLKIESRDDRPETRGNLDLSRFKNLRRLEFDLCKPSLVDDMGCLAVNLTRLSVNGVLNSLSELLDYSETQSKSSWHALTDLCVADNHIPEIDTSAGMLQGVKTLDMSRNLVKVIENLDQCYRLESLNLNHNRITSVEHIDHVLGNIKVLQLSHNQLGSIRGLHRLYALERLDVSYNVISSIEDATGLAALPLLRSLCLRGNPIASVQNYRVRVLRHFVNSLDQIRLDDAPTLLAEKEAVRELAASPSAFASVPKSPTKTSAFSTLGVSHHLVASPDEVTAQYVHTPIIAKKKRKKRKKKVPPPSTARTEEAGPGPSSPVKGAPLTQQTETESNGNGEASTTSAQSPDGANGVTTPVDGEFRERVEQLHRESGASWLVVLNEMQRPKPSTLVVSPSEEQSLHQSRESDGGTVDVQPTTITAKWNEEEQAEDEVDIDQEHLVKMAPGAGPAATERIVMLSKRFVTEVDAASGSTVCRRNLNTLHSVHREHFAATGEVGVQLMFGKEGSGHASVYVLESVSARNKMASYLEDILEAVQIRKNLLCIACNCSFPADPREPSPSCPLCKSPYVVDHNRPLQNSIAGTNDDDNSAAPLPSRTNATSAKAAMTQNSIAEPISNSLQLFLCLKVLRVGRDEDIVMLFRTHYASLLYNRTGGERASPPPIPNDSSVYVLLSTNAMYLLVPSRAADPPLKLVSFFPLSQLRRVVIGLQFQSVRVETTASVGHIFLLRDHGRTHQFVDVLEATHQAATMGESDDFEVVNYNRETVRNLRAQLELAGGTPRLYAMVYEKKGDQRAVRSLIITNNRLCLCQEDYTRYPLVRDSPAPSSPQFQSIAAEDMSDVLGVELSGDTSLSILFEHEDDEVTSRWELISETPEERARVTRVLSKVWFALFQLHLMVLTPNGGVLNISDC